MKKVSGASKEDLEDCIKKFNDQNKYTQADLFYIQGVIMIHMNLVFSLKCGCAATKLSIAMALVLALSIIWGGQV